MDSERSECRNVGGVPTTTARLARCGPVLDQSSAATFDSRPAGWWAQTWRRIELGKQHWGLETNGMLLF